MECFGLDIQPFFDVQWIISGEVTLLGLLALQVFVQTFCAFLSGLGNPTGKSLFRFLFPLGRLPIQTTK
jgi:hypothetical protein